MLERFEKTLRIACFALALILVVEFGRLLIHGDPLANLNIPQLPVLPPTTNAQIAAVTNSTAPAKAVPVGTNAVAHHDTSTNSTNATA
ncbi:MAG: hypothetical protein ACRD5L_08060, partial [Bryobacteraceae bacterium]